MVCGEEIRYIVIIPGRKMMRQTWVIVKMSCEITMIIFPRFLSHFSTFFFGCVFSLIMKSLIALTLGVGYCKESI